MSQQLRAIKCPSCGAPLDLSHTHEDRFKCKYCGAWLEDQSTPEERETGQFPKIIIRAETPARATLSPEQSGKAGRVVGAVILGAFLLFAVSIAGYLLLIGGLTIGGIAAIDALEETGAVEGVAGPEIYSFGPLGVFPADNDSQPDAAGVASLSDDTQRLLYVDFDADPPLRWQSEPLAEDARYPLNKIVASQDFVYFSFKTRLIAFDRGDGALAWEAALPDEIRNVCETCLVLLGERIVALTVDGTLQGYDARTGELVWSERLNETPHEMFVVSGNPAVMDVQGDRAGLQVYNPVDGSLLHRMEPECPNEPFPDDSQILHSVFEPVFVSPEGSVYFMLGIFEPHCIQRWDGASGALIWNSLVASDVTAGIGDEDVLVSEEGIFFFNSSVLYAVQAADGAVREITTAEDYELFPVGVAENTLVALAERTRGTRRVEIWGIGLENTSGTRLWTFLPAAAEKMRGASGVPLPEEGIWTFTVTPEGVILLQAFSEPDILMIQTISLLDGSTRDPSVLSLGDSFGSLWLQVVRWGNDRVWLETGGVLRVVDYENAAEIAKWP